MPNSTTTIYSDYDEFSKLIDRISVDDFDSQRRFCGPNNHKFGKLEIGNGSLCHKDRAELSLCGTKKERSINKWLRNRTSSLDFGVQITDKHGKTHPIHVNSNDNVLNFFEDLRFGRRTWLKRMTNAKFAAHRSLQATFFFAGNSRPTDPETLVMIDIDCKKFGTLEGALAFAQFLKEHFFPNLYIEVSTNGNGAHGFFVLEKCGLGADCINDLLLHRLQTWLRQVLSENDFDVENVEIKGTLPVIEWGESKYEVLDYRAGMLAKLPRIPTPEDEAALRETTLVSVDDLRSLPVVEERHEPKQSRVKQSSGLIASESITGKHIVEEELREIDGHYRAVAESLLDSHLLETSGRTKVTVEDVAIWLMLIKFFTENMNRDGSLPVERWREMWRALFQAGDINRSFCCQRFGIVRDYLSSLGLIAWQDESYRLGYINENGEYRKGKACKWKASDELMAMLQLPEVCEAEEGEKERTSFIRTNLLNFFRSLTRHPQSETIKPVLVDPEASLRINPDEIARFITPFEDFMGLAA